VKKFLLVILLILFSFCSSEVDEAVEQALETTITSTVASTSTVQTSIIEQEDSLVTSERLYRGVLRTSILQSVPLVYDFKNYTERFINPVHEYIEYFDYDIRIPVVDDSQQCSSVVNSAIEETVNNLIEDTKSVLEYTNPKEAEEEWGGFSEWLSIDYDIVELSEGVMSIFISYSTYSFGAAHPISATIGFNYLVEDCSEFEIQKLFDASNTEYEDLISQEMLNQLCANATKDECEVFLNFTDPFPTLTELLDCCSTFAISEFGLFVQFWEYEVSGYAQGSELILLPWYDLVSVLDKNGPYSDLLRKYSEISWIVSTFEPKWGF
tara:strand:- start:4338 stop:5309 length:972 start_codon:yes stop_codon:yes gene_type:complete